jgi:hypothetical protein
MGLDTKTYWLTDCQSQCDFDFDFDFVVRRSLATEDRSRWTLKQRKESSLSKASTQYRVQEDNELRGLGEGYWIVKCVA